MVVGPDRAATYISVTAEVLKELDLTQRSFCENLFAEDIGDFLDGHTFACLRIGRSAAPRVSKAGREGGYVQRQPYQTIPYAP